MERCLYFRVEFAEVFGRNFLFFCSAAAAGFCLSDSVCRISRNRPIAWVSNAYRARSKCGNSARWMNTFNREWIVCRVCGTHLTCHFRTATVSRVGANSHGDYFHLSVNVERKWEERRSCNRLVSVVSVIAWLEAIMRDFFKSVFSFHSCSLIRIFCEAPWHLLNAIFFRMKSY